MSNDSSSPRREPEGMLVLPYGDSHGGGFVAVWFENREITAEFSAAKMEVILALHGELSADQHIAPAARGWRPPERIIGLLEYCIEEQTLRKTVSEINRVFREAAASVLPSVRVPPLIETKRMIGIRLNWPLELETPGEPGRGG